MDNDSEVRPCYLLVARQLGWMLVMRIPNERLEYYNLLFAKYINMAIFCFDFISVLDKV